MSPKFLEWFNDIDYSEMTLQEFVGTAYSQGQKDLSAELLPALVETTGSVAFLREQVMKVTEVAAIQLAALTEEVQKHG